MKYFIVCVFLTMFASCEKNDESKQSTYISTVLEFSFEDEEGNDLLNPNFNGAFNLIDTEVFNIKDGVKTVIANNKSPHFISNERGFYVLFIQLTNDTTYLKLSESIIDTIRSQCKSGSNYEYLTKVWYNGQSVWKQEDETSLVKIIK